MQENSTDSFTLKNFLKNIPFFLLECIINFQWLIKGYFTVMIHTENHYFPIILFFQLKKISHSHFRF